MERPAELHATDTASTPDFLILRDEVQGFLHPSQADTAALVEELTRLAGEIRRRCETR